jgi:hypothetical protein
MELEIRRSTRSLPVLMHHFVSRVPGTIVVFPEIFEEQCAGMAREGWRGVGLEEAEAYLRDGRPLPEGSVLLTFDDGYLDNYVNAWPILKKYGHQAVIFAVSGRLDLAAGGADCRPTLEDVWNGRASALPAVDQAIYKYGFSYATRPDSFINWAEARRMEESGVMRLAAHTTGHASVFAGPELPVVKGKNFLESAGLRFKAPQTWPESFRRTAAPMPWGLPLFPLKPELSGPAFVLSPEFLRAVTDLVPQETEAASVFFADEAKVAALTRLTDGWPREKIGRLESLEEARERIRAELGNCAEAMRRGLGRSGVSFCWPWGYGSSLALEEARKLGYAVFYETAWGANPPAAPLAVRRFKVRNKPWPWLRLRLRIYSLPWVSAIYSRLKG